MVRRRRPQGGQAVIMVGLMMVALLSGVGLAIDAGEGFYYSSGLERAAAAGALSGVIFMPNQLLPSQAIPAGSTNDATDRAVAEAVRNGHGITSGSVTVSAVSGNPYQLQVRVSLTVPTLFMRAFGFTSYPVWRTAVAEYLQPITLGQPGAQVGSTVSQLGSGGNNYYFMRQEGWAVDRQQGDAFTPNPAYEFGAALNPSAQDVHAISGQSQDEVSDANLPARGGYNYLVSLPAGGYIQVYNAVFGPDGNGFGTTHNTCENSRVGSSTGSIGPCSSGGSYYYHEDDNLNFGDKTQFATMEYTLLKVNNTFIHGQDTELAQMKVRPIDATNWSSTSGTYTNVNTGAKINQTYNGNGSPSDMLIYHNWIDVTTYTGASDGGLVTRTLTYGSTQLPAGTYRLRVDMLNYDGTLPPGNAQAYKSYAVRALDASGNACSACTIGAWADMCYYTPISTTGGGSFTIPILSVPPTYAGRTITVDVFDAGDISGAGNVTINVLDPTGAVVSASPGTVTEYDLGIDRAGTSGKRLIGTPSTATFAATSLGTTLYNGHWVDLQVPIPSTYNPGSNPANWGFSLQYVTSTGVTATDTVTVAAGLAGVPAHLVSS